MKLNSFFAPLCALALAIPAVTTANANVGSLNPFKDEGTVVADKNSAVCHFRKNMSATDAIPTIGKEFGIQVSSLKDGKRSVRFIAEISTLNCSVKFNRKISSLGEDNAVSTDDVVYKTESSVECKNAYTSVANGGKTYSPTSGHYLVVYTMNNVPEDYWSYYFDVSVSLTYLDSDDKEQTITSDVHKANIYGGLYADNLTSTDSECVLYTGETITSETKPSGVLKRDPTYSAVVVKGDASTIDASKVTALTFGSDVKTISDNAFSTKKSDTTPEYEGYTPTYSGLTSVDFSNTSVKIGQYAFAGSTALTEVSFGDNSSGIPSSNQINIGAFANTGITYVDIPDSTNIEEYSFGGCSKLKEVVIHNECLCNLEFANCTALEKVTFAEDIKYAKNEDGNPVSCINWIAGYKSEDSDKKSFLNCTGLKEVYVYCDTISDVSGIWSYNFNGFTKLTTFVATGKTYLSPYMFTGCSGLNTVTITTNIRKIQDKVFDGSNATLTLNFDGTLDEFKAKCESTDWYKGANVTVITSDNSTGTVYNGL